MELYCVSFTTIRAWVVGLLLGWGSLAGLSYAADTPTNPPTPGAVELLEEARAQIAAKQWALAISTLNDVLRIQPKNADAHNLLGFSLRLSNPGNLPLAIASYEQALSIDPDHQGAHAYLGQARLMNQQPDLAQAHLDRLAQLCKAPTCPPYQQLADAIDQYRRTGTLGPKQQAYER